MSNNSTQEEVVFEQAVRHRSDAERAAFLDQACHGNAELRARLDLLLEGYFKAEGFLAREPGADRTSADTAIGTSIGRYKLVEKIGEGGFGVVYVAEQKEPVKRRVALKLIKLGMDTRQVVARFEAERQALALMDHPNIAKVHDGGATESGRPYFVMELVRGVPITEYCDSNQLSVRERLDLFVLVCQAVQHAHQKGIIHRDLKPSNMLVTVNDGVAVPKVIDFGVAKATQQELTEKTIFTQFHHFIGTPAYMSPEQAEMTSMDIDTRSDVYALGVLLYELLTGKTPFDGKELLASGLDEMRRIIREKEPVKPSTRLGRERASAKSEIRSLNSEIDPDLDWIVMKCLEKDRNRRYETANGLAMDLERHLNNEPVTARPPSMPYRFRKMVHRNKLAFIAAAMVALALLAGIIATSLQAIRARRAEEQQRLERARAEQRLAATMRFFNEAFNTVAPALGDVIGAARPKELLATAAAEALEDLRQGNQPNGDDLEVMGQLYLQLARSQGWFGGNTSGDYLTALSAATNAIAMLESAVAVSASDARLEKLSWAELTAGVICGGLTKWQEAIEHHRKSHRWATKLGQQTTNSDVQNKSAALKGWAIGNIGSELVSKGHYEEAITKHFLPELARLRERGNSDQSTNVLDVWDLQYINANLGGAYRRLERYEVALPYLREALHLIELIKKRRPNSAQFSTVLALTHASVGEVLLCLNQSEEGLQMLHQAKALADDLAIRDPANAGFTQTQTEVAWRSANGYIVWAEDPAVSRTERQLRLEKAETHLASAQSLLAGLKSEPLRRYLATEINPVIEKATKAKARLAAGDSLDP
jgi:serine/threonine protein kinase